MGNGSSITTPTSMQNNEAALMKNIPYDAYQLLAVPSPIGGVIVICANSIHYYSQSGFSSLSVNSFYVQAENSPDMPTIDFSNELDAVKETWLSQDVAMFSTKNGELLLLTLVFDGRSVQRLELMKSKASVLSSGITTMGSSFFFLGSRLGDSLLIQYSYGSPPPNSEHEKDEWSTKNRKVSYSRMELDEVRFEALSHIESYM